MRRFFFLIGLAAVGCSALFAIFGGSSAVAQLPEALGALAAGDYPDAVRRLTPLAEAGDPVAARLLGGLYLTGASGPKDCGKAMPLLERAAGSGDARAQYLLGRVYGTGGCVPKNARLALDWYTKAAQQDDPDAAFSVGLYLSGGEGLRADLGEAYFWYVVSLQQFKALMASRSLPEDYPGLSNMRAAQNNIEVLDGTMSASDREKAKKLLSAGSKSAFSLRCEGSETTTGTIVGTGLAAPAPKHFVSLFQIDPRVGRYCRDRCEFATPLTQVDAEIVVFSDRPVGPPEMGRTWERVDLVRGTYSKREKSSLIEVNASGQCSREPFGGFARN